MEQGFFQKVYNVAACIPEGKVATYGQIAVLAGKPHGARVVGWAMQAVPSDIKIPCHRVVNRLGTLAPEFAFGGAEVQRSMLEREGITFTADGRIDIKKYLWKPESMNEKY